jgi:hypothetical protein
MSRVDVATLRTHLPRVALSPHFHPHSEWAQVVSPVPVGVRSWGALPSHYRFPAFAGQVVSRSRPNGA